MCDTRALLVILAIASVSVATTTSSLHACNPNHTDIFIRTRGVIPATAFVDRTIVSPCARVNCVDNSTDSCARVDAGADGMSCGNVAGNIVIVPTQWLTELRTRCANVSQDEITRTMRRFKSSSADCCAIEAARRENFAALGIIVALVVFAILYGIICTHLKK
jgi:hypothetical protein